MMRRLSVFSATALLLVSGGAFAQVATGPVPFGSFSGGPDAVNNANLNVHLSVPVLVKAGRGLPLNYTLDYDNSVWWPAPSGADRSTRPRSRTPSSSALAWPRPGCSVASSWPAWRS